MDGIETPLSRALNIEGLHHLLDTEYIGRGTNLVYVPRVESTNTLAMRLAQEGSEEGVVVLTDSQTAGKGRQGRRWIDVAGSNALTSIVLHPLFPPYLLVMIASLAVVDAIANTCAIEASIKWPNDILIEDSKVAGILIETSHDRSEKLIAIVGIGVNVNGEPAQLRGNEGQPSQTDKGEVRRATTLEVASGQEVEREVFIVNLLRNLENTYLALQQEAQAPSDLATGAISRLIRERWRSLLSTLGRTIQVRQGSRFLSGVAEDVNDQGELLLRNHSGERVSITWGDVG